MVAPVMSNLFWDCLSAFASKLCFLVLWIYMNKLPFGWHHLASLYFSRNSSGATVSDNNTKQTHPTSIGAISFSLATPCPKCPTQHWVSYSRGYVYSFHCSRSFHDSCCQCLASPTWAHADHAKFKLQKMHFWSEIRWSGSDAGPLQDVIPGMYEASWASQALTRQV